MILYGLAWVICLNANGRIFHLRRIVSTCRSISVRRERATWKWILWPAPLTGYGVWETIMAALRSVVPLFYGCSGTQTNQNTSRLEDGSLQIWSKLPRSSYVTSKLVPVRLLRRQWCSDLIYRNLNRYLLLLAHHTFHLVKSYLTFLTVLIIWWLKYKIDFKIISFFMKLIGLLIRNRVSECFILAFSYLYFRIINYLCILCGLY